MLFRSVSYFLETVLIHHDRSRVEIFAYSTADKSDEVTVRLRALCDHWRDVALDNDAQICALIQGHRLDVLVDLSGHTGGNRMAVIARRAAPVQAHYLGYFASTGLTEMDYWIGDDVLLPPKANAHFSEIPWRLSRVWVSYLSPDDAPPVLWQPALDGTVWLGSFNNIAKLTDATFALWAKLLHALPQAKLLLKYKFLDEVGNLGRITSIFERCGIPADRLELRGETKGWAQHMALYNRLDIALDPVGAHAGVTTTCDALWMGVPVVSRVGDRMAQRQGASLLTAIGHPEWVAHDDEDYIAIVAALASDVHGRAALRPLQRETMRRSALCDGKGLASALEDAYMAMFDTWLQQQTERK